MKKLLFRVGILAVGLTCGVAQAAIPVKFLMAMEESVRGAELLTQVRAYTGAGAEAAELAAVLERAEFRSFREELMGKAYDYFAALNPRGNAEWSVTEAQRRFTRFYQGLTGREWDTVIRYMDSPFRDLGLYSLAEFLPQRGTRDFVGLRILTGQLAN